VESIVAVAGEGRSFVAVDSRVERGVGSMAAAAVGLHTVDQDKGYTPGIGCNYQTYWIKVQKEVAKKCRVKRETESDMIKLKSVFVYPQQKPRTFLKSQGWLSSE